MFLVFRWFDNQTVVANVFALNFNFLKVVITYLAFKQVFRFETLFVLPGIKAPKITSSTTE